MSLFDFFKKSRHNSAATAKERLQIIVAHQRNQSSQPQFLETMKQEILEVVKKYFAIDLDDIKPLTSECAEVTSVKVLRFKEKNGADLGMSNESLWGSKVL